MHSTRWSQRSWRGRIALAVVLALAVLVGTAFVAPQSHAASGPVPQTYAGCHAVQWSATPWMGAGMDSWQIRLLQEVDNSGNPCHQWSSQAVFDYGSGNGFQSVCTWTSLPTWDQVCGGPYGYGGSGTTQSYIMSSPWQYSTAACTSIVAYIYVAVTWAYASNTTNGTYSVNAC